MRSIHKPGTTFGIDSGIVIMFLLWVAVVVLVILVTLSRRQNPKPQVGVRTMALKQANKLTRL